MPARPPFIVSTQGLPESQWSYPGSTEKHAHKRDLGERAGLVRIGLNVLRVPPGHRTSWPHAEEKEEEFVYVVSGAVDAWVDGELYAMRAGDLAAFPAGTGISHTFLNNGTEDATLLVGGEADKRENRIFYPLHPSRENDMPWSRWWSDVPKRALGPHDGLPNAQRQR